MKPLVNEHLFKKSVVNLQVVFLFAALFIHKIGDDDNEEW